MHRFNRAYHRKLSNEERGENFKKGLENYRKKVNFKSIS